MSKLIIINIIVVIYFITSTNDDNESRPSFKNSSFFKKINFYTYLNQRNVLTYFSS